MQVFVRRDVLLGGAGCAAWALTANAAGQSGSADEPDPFDGMSELSALPAGFTTGLGSGAYTPSANFGSTPPPELYRQIANIILVGAPVHCRPIDVAYYFNNIRNGVIPGTTQRALDAYVRQQNRADLASPEFFKLFVYDWEHNNYYNPVVVQFLVGIGQTPYAGDLTPWCAAFVNWCIARSQATNPGYVSFSASGLQSGSQSAASGSFRCWGDDATAAPVEGDLVVWAKAGTETEGCPIDLNNAQGHVGFFCETVTRANGAQAYRVVGGNQGFVSAPNPTSGAAVGRKDLAQAVSYRTIGKTWSDRVFHSIRDGAVLRGPQ